MFSNLFKNLKLLFVFGAFQNNSKAANKNLFYLCKRNDMFVLYGCETWSLTLREEHKLRDV
jgi:hypothetical protein